MNKKARESAVHYGIDLTLTQSNLELTVEERLVQHQRALTLSEVLSSVNKRVSRGRPQFTTPGSSKK